MTEALREYDGGGEHRAREGSASGLIAPSFGAPRLHISEKVDFAWHYATNVSIFGDMISGRGARGVWRRGDRGARVVRGVGVVWGVSVVVPRVAGGRGGPSGGPVGLGGRGGQGGVWRVATRVASNGYV